MEKCMLKTLYQSGSYKVLFEVRGNCIKFELHVAFGDTPYLKNDWSLYKVTTVFVNSQNVSQVCKHIEALFDLKTYVIENLVSAVASGEYVDDECKNV